MTARVAHAAFPKGNTNLRLRDELGPLYEDSDFAAPFPRRGQPGLPPWRLALVTLMQFLENLSDRQAADAVRARIDWKYALGLELTDPGFNFSVLSEFGVWQRFATKWAIVFTSSSQWGPREYRLRYRRHGTRAEHVVRHWVLSVQVQRVLAEPVDVLRQVRAQPREGRLIELVPLLGKLPQDAGLGLDVVEDQAVRDQVVVLDQLALLVAVVLGDQALAAEEEPLDEPVERLALVGGSRSRYYPESELGRAADV
jgi:transposase